MREDLESRSLVHVMRPGFSVEDSDIRYLFLCNSRTLVLSLDTNRFRLVVCGLDI